MKQTSLCLLLSFACLPAQADVVINEFMADNKTVLQDEDGDYSDWIELKNTSANPVDLAGWHLTDNEGNPTKWALPSVTLQPGGLLMVFASNKNRATAGAELHANFELSKNGEYLALVSANGSTIEQEFSPAFPEQAEDVSYGLAGNLRETTLVGEAAPCTAIVPTPADAALGTSWHLTGFDDSSWRTGTTGVGYDTNPTFDSLINLDLEDDMLGENTTAYIRVPFTVTSISDIVALDLQMKYDDGFAAFINGVPVGSRNEPASALAYDSASSAQNPDSAALDFESLDLLTNSDALVVGENILAIHALNRSTTSSDMLIVPELSYTVEDPVANPIPGYLKAPSPGAANHSTYSGLLTEKVTFETPGGLFFGGRVYLDLSHPDPDATIRYTLDGSVPDESSPAYGRSIPIASTTLVKTAVFRPDYIPGPLSQEGYIFADASLTDFDSDVPILVIDTFNTEIPRNDTTFRDAAFAAYDPSAVTGRTTLTGAPSEGGNSGIHVRGESSQLEGFNKLNFAFETRNAERDDKDVSLFGLPAESDWALHASEIDRTFVREQLPHRLFRELGWYSPRTRPIEVFLNQDGGPVSQADYRGLYILVERIRRDPDRVDIAKLEPHENTGPDVTGGFIFKKDKSDSGDVRISTPDAGSFTIVYPTPENVTSAQQNYLQDYLRDFETALLGDSFTDPETGYAAYIDVESWIDLHVVQELTKEVDSFHFSTFYYKDKDDKIVCGPLWDFDRSFGNVSNGNDIQNPEGWNDGDLAGENIGTRGVFWDRLFEDPDFMQRYIDRWQELSESTLDESYLHSIIDTMASEVEEAKDRNFEPTGPWPLANVTRSHLTFPTYVEHVTYLKNWISVRLAWVATQFTAKPQFVQSPDSFFTPFDLELSSTSEAIYYTTDGTDPREPGGGIAGTAYTGSIPISSTTTVIARARDGREWSGPIIGTFIQGLPASAADLVVSEMMYHPAQSSQEEINAGFADEELFEYIELMNVGSEPIDLTNITISEAFDYTFGPWEIPAGARCLLVRDQAAFEFRNGTGLPVVGEYGTKKLNNSGERILITAADGSTIRDFTYDDGYDDDGMPTQWPSAPDGDGFSLVLLNPAIPIPDHNVGANWAANALPGGNPGTVSSVGFLGDPNADDDGDGIKALIEYALGTSDTIAHDTPFSTGISAFTVDAETDDYFTISYRVNQHTRNSVSVEAQLSEDLVLWEAAPEVILVSETDNLDGTITYVFRSAIPVGERSSGNEFFQILVQQ